MDRELEKIVAEAETLERETIFIFQSDNGGAVHKFGSTGGTGTTNFIEISFLREFDL